MGVFACFSKDYYNTQITHHIKHNFSHSLSFSLSLSLSFSFSLSLSLSLFISLSLSLSQVARGKDLLDRLEEKGRFNEHEMPRRKGKEEAHQ